MQSCVIDPCGVAASGAQPFCLPHWKRLDERTQWRLYWTLHDWRERSITNNAIAYHKEVALAVAELTAQVDVEAGEA
jgi:hypothetical protein